MLDMNTNTSIEMALNTNTNKLKLKKKKRNIKEQKIKRKTPVLSCTARRPHVASSLVPGTKVNI